MRNRIKRLAFEAGSYSQVVIIQCQTEFSINKKIRETIIASTVFKTNKKGRNIGSNLIMNLLLKIPRQDSRSFTIVFSDNMFLIKRIKKRQYFLFQLAMKMIQAKWDICFTHPILCFNKTTYTAVTLAAWLMNFSTLGNIFLQGLLQLGLSHSYISKEHVYTRLVPAQEVHFFCARSHFSALQNCAVLFSTNFKFFFILKNA